MIRDADQHLAEWLRKSQRKPLVIRGARQVGKSYLVRKFARQQAKQLFELNFEQTPELVSMFASRDPRKILNLLAVHYGRDIDPQGALLFLDEIQAAPEILGTLRYFYEQMPELPVMAAGSLLEFVLDDHEFSMPVSKYPEMLPEHQAYPSPRYPTLTPISQTSAFFLATTFTR